jgi:murein DD-endopeptidase MepM/ murein hydrolase activator NlpD
VRWLALLLLLLPPLPAGAVEFTLEGTPQQGALLYGRTEPGATVMLGEASVPVAADGRFLIGLDRDAPATVTVSAGKDGVIDTRTLEVVPRDYAIQRIDGLPPEQVTPPPELLERLAAERAQLLAARALERPTLEWAGGFAWPAEGRISGVFGSQRILNGEPRQPHYGVDVAIPSGTPVKAPADGLVVLAAEDFFYQGTLVMIDHGLGLKSTLMHLSELEVATGDVVTKGQVVALSGASGRVTGAHLDWRVNWLGNWIDPQQLVPPME